MRYLVAFDKFKEALTATAACDVAVEALVAAGVPSDQIGTAPLTDGGEGFCSILTKVAGGTTTTHRVCGPLGQFLEAEVGWVSSQHLQVAVRRTLLPSPANPARLSIIELASAAGFEAVDPRFRDPRKTTTAGVGELIQHAIGGGADAILLGLGGSATNDLGLGALNVLGFTFLTENGAPLQSPPTPEHWPKVARIVRDSTPRPNIPIFLACDVDNPLLGPRGAAAVFGPQKGLPREQITVTAQAATRMAALLEEACGVRSALRDQPGAGAAGGIAYGLTAALGARIVLGFKLVSDWLELPVKIAAADCVLGGEGRFDRSSLGGKGPFAVLTAAHQMKRRAAVFAGSVDFEGLAQAPELPEVIDKVQITPFGQPLPEALRDARENLFNAIRDWAYP